MQNITFATSLAAGAAEKMAWLTSDHLRVSTLDFLLGPTPLDHLYTKANEPSSLCPYLRIGIVVKWHFWTKITQNVFPLYSDRFVYLLSIKFTFIAVTYLVFHYFVGICKNCIFPIFYVILLV